MLEKNTGRWCKRSSRLKRTCANLGWKLGIEFFKGVVQWLGGSRSFNRPKKDVGGGKVWIAIEAKISIHSCRNDVSLE